MEKEICALLNIKHAYFKDKFKNVNIFQKRSLLIEYLIEEFGPFDISKCQHVFEKHGYYTIGKINSYILMYSTLTSIIFSYIFDQSYNFSIFVFTYIVVLFGSLYAK